MARQIADAEQKRADLSVERSVATLKARQEQGAVNRSRVESGKVDVEAKEQQKVQHLRKEGQRREAARLNALESELKREHDKLVRI